MVDLVGGLKIVELDQEIGGQVDVNGLRRLDLECGMTEAKAGAQGAKAAATAACGEMTAFVFVTGNHFVIGDPSDSGRAG